MPDSLHPSNDIVATRNEISPAERVSVEFHKSLWTNWFMSNNLTDQGVGEAAEYEVLKEELRQMVVTTIIKDDEVIVVEDKLRFIDAIQRLGVAYLYEMEIEAELERMHSLGVEFILKKTHLYLVALWFRLLRQQGFPVSPDVFRKFKDNDGKFSDESASEDEQAAGLLSLYEASHLAIHGEDILEEARVFTTKNFNNNHNSLSSFHKQVKFALSLPIWKCVPRTLTRNYIDFYSEDNTVDQKLLRFAKLDFNMLQKFHQQELREITKWWDRLQVTVKFPHARDRVVECYYWIYAVYFEPRYHISRMILTKIISMLSLLDDTFDNFGTYEEVHILTQAIQRFDVVSLETLPDMMKNMYRVIIDLYNEIEMELGKIGHSFALDYAKEELKRICRSYLVKVKWRTEGHVPKMKEYKTVAYVSGGLPTLCTSAFMGMGAGLATREAFEWVTNNTKMVSAVSAIARLQNDIVSHKLEQKRKHVATSVGCYIKEHNVSEEEAIEILWEEISGAWKDIVASYQKPTPFPVALMDRLLNFASSFNVIYEHGDGYTNPHLLKSHIASLFVDPVPLL
ncbi:Alpha-copaene synthase [Linum grandiflorum]